MEFFHTLITLPFICGFSFPSDFVYCHNPRSDVRNGSLHGKQDMRSVAEMEQQIIRTKQLISVLQLPGTEVLS